MQDLQAQLDAAQAAYNQAEAELSVAEDLFEAQGAAAKPLSNTDAEHAAWQAAIEKVEKAQERLRDAATALAASQDNS